MRNKRPLAIAAVPLLIAAAVVLFLVARGKEPEGDLLSGTVESAHADASSKIPGRIDSLFVHEGDPVTKGQVIARLESSEMEAKVDQAAAVMAAARARMDMARNGLRPEEREAARNLYQQAKAQYDMLAKTWNRISTLFADSVISAQERDQVEAQFTASREQMDAAKARYDMAMEGSRNEDREAARSLFLQAESGYREACDYAAELTLKSPINGQVEKTVSRAGEIVAAGYPIVTVVDTADAWVVLQVKETAMRQFRMGASFSGRVPALGDSMVAFRVSYVAPMADFALWRPTNQRGAFDVRTFEIHLRPSAPCTALRAGMTVNFTLPGAG
jgi:HlyD family secretion protein